MIDGKNLKIGNWIGYGKNKMKVSTGSMIDYIISNPEAYHPLALDAEVLKKCGWKKGNENFWHKKDRQGWLIDTDARGNFFMLKDNKVIIESVHHLQNIFQALTLEELEIEF